MFIDLGTEVTFEAAHFLHDHPKCGVMHGHTWKVRVMYQSIPISHINDLPSDGMLVDFGKIKSVVKENFDHTLLNDIVKGPPTAERIAILLTSILPVITGRNYILVVEVYETPTNMIRVERPFSNE